MESFPVNLCKSQIVRLTENNGKICQSYDVWQMKEKNGVKKMAILRSTFIIDKAGQLVEAMYGVSHENHAQEILDLVKKI